MNALRMFARARERMPIVDAIPDNAGKGSKAVMRLYDPIDSYGGDWGVSAKEFAAALDALPDDVNEIELHINSPGGEVWEGLAILNSLRNHKARVTTIVDGIAASSASFIAMAGDEIVMARNSEMFLHDAWGLVMGNAADMAKMAADLDHESTNLASVYSDRAGGTAEEWRAVMGAETWFSDSEAVAAGLADRVIGSDPEPAAKAKARFDLSMFNRADKAPKTPAADAPGQPSKEGDATMAFLDDVRQRLGVTDAATDETVILAALDEALKPAEPTEPAIPADSVVVSKAKWDEMKSVYDTMRDQLTSLLDEKATERREVTVKAAISAGKIMPAEKRAYLNALEMDEEGTVKRLDALQAGIVPVAAAGHAEDRDVSPAGVRGWSDSLFPDITHSDQEAN